MLVKVKDNGMLQQYTVDNKNIDRQEKIQRRSLPHLRKIKLYSKELYIPIGQHGYSTDPNKHKLTQAFVYNDHAEGIPQDIIDEQNYVMLQIGMGGLRTGLIEMKTGRGKCFGKGTEILMIDGSKKNVEDICLGDKVMGRDSKERNVTNTTSGIDMLYRITTIKGDSFICNGEHILVLRCSYDYKGLGMGELKKGQIIKMSVDKYIALSKEYKKTTHLFKMFTVDGIEFGKKELEIDPYFLGLWLGDGSSRCIKITNPDKEMRDYIERYASDIGMKVVVGISGGDCPNFGIVCKNRSKSKVHSLQTLLRKNNLLSNKYIPQEYLTSCTNDRLELLAGLLDSDGYYDRESNRFTFTNTNKKIIDGILYLARSLGFFARKSKGRYTKSQNGTQCFSFNVEITGNIETIPTKIERKKAKVRRQNKNRHNVGFKIEEIGVGNYYGFAVDGDNMFVLGNFLVTHNSNLILKMVNEFQEKCLILVHNQKTLKELKEKFEKFSNTTPGEWWSGKKNMQEIMITTHKSFVQNTAIFRGKFGIIFYDEADVNLSGDMITALSIVDAEGLFGLTGTPKRQELDLNDLQLIYGPHIKLAGQENNGYNLIPNIVQLRYNTSVCSFDSFHDLKEQLMTEQSRLKKQQDFVKYVNQKMGVSLFLVSRVEECRIYHELFNELKIPNVIVNGKTKLADDEKNIRQMVEQKGIIVATAQKMGRGVDIPEVQAVFLFYPTRFEGNVVQSVGRALRSHPSKEKVYLFDWVDDSVLSGQGYERKKTYYKEYHGCIVKELKIDENSFTQS